MKMETKNLSQDPNLSLGRVKILRIEDKPKLKNIAKTKIKNQPGTSKTPSPNPISKEEEDSDQYTDAEEGETRTVK